MGYNLKNPLIIASSPLTETLEGIIECFNNGASAVVTKSISRIADAKQIGARRACLDEMGFWATSTFYRETLNLERGCDLISCASAKIDIPIIASVTGLNFNLNQWSRSCEEVTTAGASMIQLDLFYLPQPITQKENLEKMEVLITELSKTSKIPIIPKLNIEIPAYLVQKLFKKTNIECISFLDSIRVSSPTKTDLLPKFGMVKNLGMSSLFGPWQLPLTYHYAIILRKTTNYQMIGGGGISKSFDILNLLMLGVNATQIASSVILNGYGYISKLILDLEKNLKEVGVNSVNDILNRVANTQSIDTEQSQTLFIDSFAMINQEKCIKCKKCLDLSFCHAILEKDGKISINNEYCDGCGLCVSICSENAIYLKKRG